VVTYLIFKVIDVMVGLRVEEEDETQGLDIISHNERGYDI
jgi:Amt family ammonium transporter